MFNLAPAIPARSDLEWCWYLRRHGRAGDALERILHDIGAMDPGGWANWQPSTLTDTGAPIAVNFSTADHALALTTEVDDPGNDAATRFARACEIAKTLGGASPSAAFRDVVSAAQSSAYLDFGARLGLRHDGTKLSTIIYAEIPAAASDLSALVSDPPFTPILEDYGSAARATKVAYNTDNGEVTIYCEADNANRTILPALCLPAQVSPDILSMSIDGMTAGPPRIELPTRKLGFSYTIPPKNERPVLALSFSSKELFKDDIKIEERVRACGGSRLPTYTSLTEHLPVAPWGTTHHGHFAMTARQNAAPILSIDVAAPWVTGE
ncbi:hypothetical protein [Loktanella sp. S4079]|uniref:hypothetical protein n=1 Tax=Loktanella sp. S4079 TaxID=579483 RepID=UPI00061F2FED|nr:hypothetical protein [Loktanella sp. S4079]KJZ19235.1 hypothetical protein TW80_10590 [Loktanella sp. S4079]